MVQAVGVSDIYPAQQILYTLSLIAVLVPAYPSFKGGNVGIILLDLWLIFSLGILLIDASVWRGNLRNPAPVYCDISTAIIAMSGVGYQAAFLCINRTLYRLSKTQTSRFTKSTKRKEMIIDLCIGIGLPVLNGVGHGIVQGHRYNIVEDVGCQPTVAGYNISMPLFIIWPLAISVVSGVIGLLAFRNFIRRRRTFDSHLVATNSSIKKGLYLRLMIVSCYDLVCAVPYYSWGIAYNLKVGLIPFTTWEDLQYNWWAIRYFDRLFIDTSPGYRVYLIVYMVGAVNLGFSFFIMFGLSQEAKECYKTAYYWCMKPFGIKPPDPEDETVATSVSNRGWLDVLLRRGPRQTVSTDRHVTASIPVFSTGSGSDNQRSRGTYVTGTSSGSDPATVWDGSRSKVGKEKDLELTTMNFEPVQPVRSRDSG